MKLLLIVFVLVVLNECSSKVTSHDLDSICKNIDNSYECAKAIEMHQLPLYKDYVSRKDMYLILKLDNGSSKKIINTNLDTDSVVSYCFRDYIESINSYLLFIQYFEGGNFLIVDKATGNSSVIIGIPVISKNKTRFAVVNLDLLSQYTTNGFQIYRIDKGKGYISEYEEYPEDWGPSNIKWINDNEIEIEKSKLDSTNNQLNSEIVITKIGSIRLVYEQNWHRK